jgi:hypothetical protein
MSKGHLIDLMTELLLASFWGGHGVAAVISPTVSNSSRPAPPQKMDAVIKNVQRASQLNRDNASKPCNPVSHQQRPKSTFPVLRRQVSEIPPYSPSKNSVMFPKRFHETSMHTKYEEAIEAKNFAFSKLGGFRSWWEMGGKVGTQRGRPTWDIQIGSRLFDQTSEPLGLLNNGFYMF